MNSSTTAKPLSWTIPLHRRETGTLARIVRTLAMALGITLLQVAVVLLLAVAAQRELTPDTYASLCQWDGHLYARILQDGYRTTIPPSSASEFTRSNVAFFPGYPVAGQTIRTLSANWLSVQSSLVLAAQLSAWGFWTYWLLFLRRFRASRQLSLVATSALALHPAGFYLVLAFSESLFLFGMFGFFYWLSDARGRWGWAIPHGIVMSSTRLGGIPVAYVPLIAQGLIECAPTARSMVDGCKALAPGKRVRSLLTTSSTRAWNDRDQLERLATAGFAASLGGLAFFAYCQWRFGYWDLYFWTQQMGASVAPDWFWWLRPSSYTFIGSLVYDHVYWTNDLSRLCVAVTVIVLVIMARWEWRRAQAGDQSWQQRLPLYLSAAGLFFLHAAGVSPILMQSMVRYVLPVHALLLLALVHACTKGPLPAWLAQPRRGRLAVAFTLMACLQLALVWRFFTNQWVS